jgi:hypothetical protein
MEEGRVVEETLERVLERKKAVKKETANTNGEINEKI